MTAVLDMLVDGLDYLGVDQELVHLTDGASVFLSLVVVGMLIVDTAVFLTTLLHKADAPEVMMMKDDAG